MLQATSQKKIIFNKYYLIIYLSQFPDAANSAPIKFHTATDPIHTRANHHNCTTFKVEIIFTRIVSHIQVVCKGRVLCSYCVNLLHKRGEAIMLTNLANCNFSAENKEMMFNSTPVLRVRRSSIFQLVQISSKKFTPKKLLFACRAR